MSPANDDATIVGNSSAEAIGAGRARVNEQIQGVRAGNVLGGRYEIISMLGEGGMGAVFKAHDRELNRPVALKIVRPELARNPEMLDRFKQELILARKVTHRNVIRIFDLGESDGLKFITMEYVEGRSLGAVLRERGKLPLGDAIDIIRQTAFALEAAHAEGVIHRDLKPDNIMLDDRGKVSVMDFGLARSAEFAGMTQTGALVGTLHYMSPEQANGRALDERSDLFALGIIFYELLTGADPYRAESEIASLVKRSKERAAPVTTLDPTIPPKISTVVLKCLEIDPAKRYSSARALLADLDSASTHHATVLERALPRVRNAFSHRRWALAAGALVLLLAVAAVVTIRMRRGADPASQTAVVATTSLAVLPFENNSGETSLDWLRNGMAELLQTELARSASVRTVAPERVQQILRDLRVNSITDLDEGTITRVADFSNAGTLIWGKYARIGHSIRIDATLHDTKRHRVLPFHIVADSEDALLGAISELAKSIKGELAAVDKNLASGDLSAMRLSTSSLAAQRSYAEGIHLARQGNHLEALKKFQAATENDASFALGQARLAETYANLGYDSDAERIARQALTLASELPSHERYMVVASASRVLNDDAKAIESYEELVKLAPADSELHFNLGKLYENSAQFEEAHQHYQQVLQLDPKYVEALLAIGRTEIKRGRPQDSLDYLNRALSLAIQFDHRESKATILHAVGVAYRLLDRPDEALRHYRDSLEIKRGIGDRRGIAVSLNESAQVQLRLGRPEDAMASYQEALKIRRDIGDKSGVGATLMDLGNLYSDRGQHDLALKHYKESLAVQKSLGDADNEARCLHNIGTVYLAKAQYDDALTYLERALQLRQKANVPSDLSDTLHNIADAYLKVGQLDRATSYYLQEMETARKAGYQRGVAQASFGMGAIFDQQGRYAASLASREEAYKQFTNLHDTGPWLAEIQAAYGYSLAMLGRRDEASKNLDDALALAKQLQITPVTVQILNARGEAQFYAGDLTGAQASFHEAERLVGRLADKPIALQSRLNQLKVQVKQGVGGRAVPALRKIAADAEALQLRYQQTEATLYLAEALYTAKQVAQALEQVKKAVQLSDSLGTRALRARAGFVHGTVLAALADSAAASAASAQARKLAEEIRAEAKSDFVSQRIDLKPIFDSGATASANLGRR